MDGQRGESEQLYNAYASALALHSQAPDAKSIAFVSMGKGVYKWPMALAADIAVKALTSTFDQTLMCVMDEATRLNPLRGVTVAPLRPITNPSPFGLGFVIGGGAGRGFSSPFHN